jgi:hypothetical protein
MSSAIINSYALARPLLDYIDRVRAESPSFFWPLQNGSLAYDRGGINLTNVGGSISNVGGPGTDGSDRSVYSATMSLAASSINAASNNGVGFSFAGWFYFDDNIEVEYIHSNFNSAGGKGYLWRRDASTELRLGVELGTPSANTAVASGSWNHLAVTFTVADATARIYVNGVQTTVTGPYANTSMQSSTLFRLGGRSTDTALRPKMRVAWFAFWQNQVIAADRIERLATKIDVI